MEESPLSPALLRGLADRSYDKRKAAAAEVTLLVKYLSENNEHEKIARVLSLLTRDFTRSRNANHRKGGLIGLASVAIGLFPQVQQYLPSILLPILSCFDDQEPRVCYYACESCYNVVKVARAAAIVYCNEVVEGLCKLFAHNDLDIRNGVSLLDRLVKDVVIESPRQFQVTSFIPLLQKYMVRRKPYIRQLMLSWVEVLCAVPDTHMLDFLPDFLDGLLQILSDPNREIRRSAENLLTDFIDEIRHTEVVDLLPLVSIVQRATTARELLIRATAVRWLTVFVEIGDTKLLPVYAAMFDAISHCIADVEADVAEAAMTADGALYTLVQRTPAALEYKPFVGTILRELQSTHTVSRVSALRWLLMLHTKSALETNRSLHALLPLLLRTLSDTDSQVVALNLQVMAQISADARVFGELITSLTALFSSDRELLETRGALIIRKLCAMLDATSVFSALADALLAANAAHSVDFLCVYSHALNVILLTAPETQGLRAALKTALDTADPSHRAVFTALFRAMALNPAALLSLCLVSEAYALSAALVMRLTEQDLSIGLLMQLDKLVHLIESPVFVPLRMQLLDPASRQFPDLLRTLYGLLMLLPQSEAYRILSARLQACSALHAHLGHPSSSGVAGVKGGTPAGKQTSSSSSADTAELIEYFVKAHAKQLPTNRSSQQTSGSNTSPNNRDTTAVTKKPLASIIGS